MTTNPNFAVTSGTGSTYSGNGSITMPSYAAGDTLYAAFSNSTNATTNFITTMPTNWVRIGSKGLTTNACELWYYPNAPSGITTVSFTTSVGGNKFPFSSSGINNLDQTASGSLSSAGGSFTVTTGTVSAICELVVGVASCDVVGEGAGATVPSGFVSLVSLPGGKSGSEFIVYYQIRMSPLGTQSVTQPFTALSSTVNCSCVIATFTPVANLIQIRDARCATNSIAVSGPTASTSFTLNAAPVPGNMQVLIGGLAQSSGTPVGVGGITQTSVATWHQDESQSASGSSIGIWRAYNAPSGAGTTLTFTNAVNAVYFEVFGVNALDKIVASTAACVTGTTTLSSGTLGSTLQNPEIAICAMSGYSSGKGGGNYSTSPTGGFTWVAQSANAGTGSAGEIAASYKLLFSSAQTPSTTNTLTNTVSTSSYSTAMASYYQGVTSNHNLLAMIGAG